MTYLEPFTSPDGGGLPAGIIARMVEHGSAAFDGTPLSPEDAVRVSRMKAPDRRQELDRSLRAVQRVLSDWLDRPTADCMIARDSKGAPSLPSMPGTRISLSRTEGWTAVALSPSGAIGIDVERIRPLEWQPMLSMVCAPEEARLLLGLDHGVLDAFYRLWTAKEAAMKASGEGFRMGAPKLRLPDAFLTGNASAASLSGAHGTYDVHCAQQGALMVSLALAAD